MKRVVDLSAAKRLKVDGTIGRVISEGERLGVPTPLCRAVFKIYREIEDRQRPIGIQNYAELYSVR